MAFPLVPNLDRSLCNKILWSTVSKTAYRSSSKRTTHCLLSIDFSISFWTRRSAVSQLWCFLKVVWRLSFRLLPHKQSVRRMAATFSVALHKNFRLDTGRKLEQGLMMEYLHWTAAHVVALKSNFCQEHYSNLSK